MHYGNCDKLKGGVEPSLPWKNLSTGLVLVCVQDPAVEEYQMSLYKDAEYKHEVTSFPAYVEHRQTLYVRVSRTAPAPAGQLDQLLGIIMGLLQLLV